VTSKVSHNWEILGKSVFILNHTYSIAEPKVDMNVNLTEMRYYRQKNLLPNAKANKTIGLSFPVAAMCQHA